MSYTDVLYEVKNQIAWLTISTGPTRATPSAGRPCWS